jgi:hypothetical protein
VGKRWLPLPRSKTRAGGYLSWFIQKVIFGMGPFHYLTTACVAFIAGSDSTQRVMLTWSSCSDYGLASAPSRRCHFSRSFWWLGTTCVERKVADKRMRVLFGAYTALPGVVASIFKQRRTVRRGLISKKSGPNIDRQRLESIALATSMKLLFRSTVKIIVRGLAVMPFYSWRRPLTLSPHQWPGLVKVGTPSTGRWWRTVQTAHRWHDQFAGRWK